MNHRHFTLHDTPGNGREYVVKVGSYAKVIGWIIKNKDSGWTVLRKNADQTQSEFSHAGITLDDCIEHIKEWKE